MYHEKNVIPKLHIINFFYIKNDTYVVRIEFYLKKKILFF